MLKFGGVRRKCGAPPCKLLIRDEVPGPLGDFCPACRAMMDKQKQKMLEAVSVEASDAQLVAWRLRRIPCEWCGGGEHKEHMAVRLDEDKDPICARCSTLKEKPDRLAVAV